jgi:glycosyltransferase involved in cell wall biosynthesis
MRVLLVHNYYQQPGGEDQVFAAEAILQKAHGHRVICYTVHNDCVKDMSSFSLVGATVWNRAIARELRQLIRRERPHVIHFHNTFPLISPAAYYVARDEGVPMVQTLHNYRFLCPNALFFRSGHICEDCVGKILSWPGIFKACYRNSRAQTAVVATMVAVHRWLKTWQKQVDMYIALTEFARRKFIEWGIPSYKIVVKPNFTHPEPRPKNIAGNYVIFIGRLSPEKGLWTLFEAWRNLKDIPLKLIGDGLLLDKTMKLSPESVEVLGKKSYSDVLSFLSSALFLVLPAECYEGFPMVIAEAMAYGVPVVASHLGAMAEIVDDGRTGLLFEAGNAEDLASKVRWLFENPEKAEEMGRNARAEYEKKYTPELNYKMLLRIYEMAIENRKWNRHIS